MQKKMLAVVALAALAALAAGVVAGCGGGTATYTNDEYGFSFDYDGGTFTESDATSAQGSAGGSSAFTVAFTDPDGTRQGDSYKDGFLVNVYELNVTIDESLMPAVQEEVAKLLPELAKTYGSDATFSALEKADVGDTLGLVSDWTYDLEGTPFKARMYFLFSGDKEYQLTFQAADDRWSELEPKFQEVIDTFSVGSSE